MTFLTEARNRSPGVMNVVRTGVGSETAPPPGAGLLLFGDRERANDFLEDFIDLGDTGG